MMDDDDAVIYVHGYSAPRHKQSHPWVTVWRFRLNVVAVEHGERKRGFCQAYLFGYDTPYRDCFRGNKFRHPKPVSSNRIRMHAWFGGERH